MLGRLTAILLVAATLSVGGNAAAAISTFPASVFQNGGTGANNLIGNTAATARLNRGQTIGLFYGAGSTINTVTGSRLFFNVTTVTNNTTYIWLRFGNWNGATFTNAFATGQTAPGGGATTNVYAQVTSAGVVTVFGAPFATSCALIGGCNAVVFGNSTFSAAGSSFRLSSLVASTPEPSAWALMMLGFGGIASRLKAQRRRKLHFGVSALSRA
jgi:hypothetical protein